MPIPALLLFGAGFAAAHLLSSSDDHVSFEEPFLVRLLSDNYRDIGVHRGEYITIMAYVSNTGRKELLGVQQNGRFELTVKAKHVVDVGDIGEDGWLAQTDEYGNHFYTRSSYYGEEEEIVYEDPREAAGIRLSRPEGLDPRRHNVYGDKGRVDVDTAYT